VVRAVAVDNNSEREVISPSSNCCFTAHADLGLTVRIPYTQNQPGPIAQISLASVESASGMSYYIMLLKLITFGDVPAIGKHNGTFTEIKTASGKDAEGNEFNHLIVAVELETTDSKGQKYRLEKSYNLAGRGLATFRSDYRDWTGKKLSDKDLAAFDADKLMKGQRVVVVVKHIKDGKETIARIDTFLPVPSTAQVSGS
jgi:hypothetical protein